MKQVAFFDLDNTLVRGSSLFYFARKLMSEGLIPRRKVALFALIEARFVLLRNESREHRNRIATNALALANGHSVAEIDALCNRIAEQFVRDRTVPSTLQALREHQAAGHETWLVTAAPTALARVVAERLGMTGALGTSPDITDGLYSGTLTDGLMHGQRKALGIAALAAERGLDLANAAAYSDSENDLPMLSLTGRAAVVNANRRLRHIAHDRGWTVLPACHAPSTTASAVPAPTAQDDELAELRAMWMANAMFERV